MLHFVGDLLCEVSVSGLRMHEKLHFSGLKGFLGVGALGAEEHVLGLSQVELEHNRVVAVVGNAVAPRVNVT